MIINLIMLYIFSLLRKNLNECNNSNLPKILTLAEYLTVPTEFLASQLKYLYYIKRHLVD